MLLQQHGVLVFFFKKKLCCTHEKHSRRISSFLFSLLSCILSRCATGWAVRRDINVHLPSSVGRFGGRWVVPGPSASSVGRVASGCFVRGAQCAARRVDTGMGRAGLKPDLRALKPDHSSCISAPTEE